MACGPGLRLANVATHTCAAGACGVGTCATGFSNCDGMAVNGCETNTQTSITHCGARGMACTLANAAATCTGGACAVGSCNAGFGNRDGMAATAARLDTQTSNAHCGACNNACPSGRPAPRARASR
ncbi:MAG: hypothetical protein U0325_13720 [Polyangiales bacterium]